MLVSRGQKVTNFWSLPKIWIWLVVYLTKKGIESVNCWIYIWKYVLSYTSNLSIFRVIGFWMNCGTEGKERHAISSAKNWRLGGCKPLFFSNLNPMITNDNLKMFVLLYHIVQYANNYNNIARSAQIVRWSQKTG